MNRTIFDRTTMLQNGAVQITLMKQKIGENGEVLWQQPHTLTVDPDMEPEEVLAPVLKHLQDEALWEVGAFPVVEGVDVFIADFVKNFRKYKPVDDNIKVFKERRRKWQEEQDAIHAKVRQHEELMAAERDKAFKAAVAAEVAAQKEKQP